MNLRLEFPLQRGSFMRKTRLLSDGLHVGWVEAFFRGLGKGVLASYSFKPNSYGEGLGLKPGTGETVNDLIKEILPRT